MRYRPRVRPAALPGLRGVSRGPSEKRPSSAFGTFCPLHGEKEATGAPAQAPDTRALFRSDRQYATVTPIPSSTASVPPITATSFGAAIQNPA